MKKQYIAGILGVVCFLLVISIFMQMKTVNDMQNSVGTTLSKNNGELIDEVFRMQEKYDIVYKQLEESEKELENIRTKAVSGNQEDANAETELKENNLMLGLTEVKGEGIIIILDDNRNAKDEINVAQYLVHEEDLLQVVNELFNAGAEAISINGHRVVSSTSILCDGNIIRVNGEIITVPITIEAVCSTAIYNTLIRPGGYLQLMADEGVKVKIDSSDNIIIPKYNGVYNYTHLTRGEEK
ncbi:MAG: DUF881 domain-containing protein [Clostridia bacterium]